MRAKVNFDEIIRGKIADADPLMEIGEELLNRYIAQRPLQSRILLDQAQFNSELFLTFQLMAAVFRDADWDNLNFVKMYQRAQGIALLNDSLETTNLPLIYLQEICKFGYNFRSILKEPHLVAENIRSLIKAEKYPFLRADDRLNTTQRRSAFIAARIISASTLRRGLLSNPEEDEVLAAVGYASFQISHMYMEDSNRIGIINRVLQNNLRIASNVEKTLLWFII